MSGFDRSIRSAAAAHPWPEGRHAAEHWKPPLRKNGNPSARTLLQMICNCEVPLAPRAPHQQPGPSHKCECDKGVGAACGESITDYRNETETYAAPTGMGLLPSFGG